MTERYLRGYQRWRRRFGALCKSRYEHGRIRRWRKGYTRMRCRCERCLRRKHGIVWRILGIGWPAGVDGMTAMASGAALGVVHCGFPGSWLAVVCVCGL